MTNHVLVSLGKDDASFEAVKFAVKLYKDIPDSQITVAHVASSRNDSTEELLTEVDEYLAQSEVEGEYSVEFISQDGFISTNAHAGEIISEFIKERDVSHVLMGMPSKSVFRHLLQGSATSEVIGETETPVTLVGDKEE